MTTKQIQEILILHGKTLATAESCTSGRIAAEITKISGEEICFQNDSSVLYRLRSHLEIEGRKNGLFSKESGHKSGFWKFMLQEMKIHAA